MYPAFTATQQGLQQRSAPRAPFEQLARGVQLFRQAFAKAAQAFDLRALAEAHCALEAAGFTVLKPLTAFSHFETIGAVAMRGTTEYGVGICVDGQWSAEKQAEFSQACDASGLRPILLGAPSQRFVADGLDLEFVSYERGARQAELAIAALQSDCNVEDPEVSVMDVYGGDDHVMLYRQRGVQ